MNDALKPSPLRWLLVLAIVAAAVWVSRSPAAARTQDRSAAAVIWPGDCAACPTPGGRGGECAEDCVFCPRPAGEQPQPPAQAPEPVPVPTPVLEPQPEPPKPALPRKTT